MKKTLVALAALGAIAGAAQAQSTVTLYGIADVWFGSETDDNGTTSLSQTKLNSGGVSGNRFGLMGSEDLGGGLMANFRLEQGFSSDSGAANTVTGNSGGTASTGAFSRASWVGLSGASWGSTRFGRTATPYDDVSGAHNANIDSALSPMGKVFMSNKYTSRPSNTLAYYTPNMSGFNAGISYSLGEDKTATRDAGSVTSLSLAYASGPLSVSFGYQTEKLATTAITVNAPAGGGVVTTSSVITLPTDSTDYTRLSGSYDFGVAVAKLVYGKRDLGDASTDDFLVGVDVPFGATTLSASFASSQDNDDAGDAKRTGFGLSAKYNLSKRTFVYGGYQADKTETPNVVDTKHNLFAVGINHRF